MQKRLIAISTAVVALALVSGFSVRSARADSIHNLDFDSFAPSANACGLSCILDSVFAADTALFSDKHAEFPLGAQIGWEDWTKTPRGMFGFPVASHFDHHEGDGNPRNSTVPEPGSLLMASFGLVGLLLLKKTRRRNPPFPPAVV